MKKLLSAAVAALVITGSAQAATYNVGVTADPFNAPGVAGLQTRAVILSPSGPQKFNGSNLTFDLVNIGDSFSADIYGLVAYDAPMDADDLIAGPSNASFDFGALIGSHTVFGTSQGFGQGALGYAFATFVSKMVNIGSGQGILIELSDTVFATDDDGNFVNGRAGVGFVNAKFTLAAIPVPAAGFLLMGALAGLALVRRRKAA